MERLNAYVKSALLGALARVAWERSMPGSRIGSADLGTQMYVLSKCYRREAAPGEVVL